MKRSYVPPPRRVLPAAGYLTLACLLASSLPGYGQGTVGFSGQTQPSRVVDTRVVTKEMYDKARATAGHTKLTLSEQHVQDVADGDVDLADEAKILKEYDDVKTAAEVRTQEPTTLRVGIVSDGDFSKNTSASNISTAKAGSLGIDAVWMKKVYYTRTYAQFAAGTEAKALAERRQQADTTLVGTEVIERPLWVFNTLAVLLSGTASLSTGLAAGAPRAATTTQAQQRVFGQALLVPSGYVNGNGVSFTVNAAWNFGVLHPDQLFVKNLGLLASTNVVQTNWSSRDTATVVNVLAPSLGLNYRLVEAHFKAGGEHNYVLVQPFVRGTMRYLFGDVQNNPQLLHDAIGTTQRAFYGVDAGVTFTVDAVRFTFNVPIFNDATIAGFTQGQAVVGFGVAAVINLTE